MRSFVRSVAWLLLATSATSCLDNPTPSAPTGGAGQLRLDFQPHYSLAATQALHALASAGVSVDRVRLAIVRPPSDTIKDTTVVFPAGVDSLPIVLLVKAPPGEQLVANLGYYAGSTLLFTGVAVVTVQITGTQGSATPPTVEIAYAGPDQVATRIAISPSGGTFGALTPLQFAAQAFDASNAVVPNVPFTWSTDGTLIASINASGALQFTGVTGNVVVTATTPKGLAASVTVSFGSLAPATIAIAPRGGTLASLGDLLALSAVVRDQFGNVVAQAPSWTSRASSIASVASNGTVQAVANGSAYVVATAGVAKDSVLVTVNQLVDTLLLSRDTLRLALLDTATITVRALDRNRNAIVGVTPSFTTSSAAIATVSTSGLVKLVASGTTTVAASAGGKSSSAVVMQGQGSVGISVGFAFIRITPGSGSLRMGTSTQLAAEYVDASGKATPIAPQWASSDPGRAPVSGAGVLSPADTTTATISATYNGLVGHATFSVLPAPTLSAFSFAPLALSGVSLSTVRFSASVSAAEPGGAITMVTIDFTGPGGVTRSCTATTPTTGVAAKGTWDCAISIPAGVANAGIWHASRVSLAGSITRSYDETQLATFGVTTLTVTP